MPKNSQTPHDLKIIRKATGMTQDQMATRLGISKSLLQKIENRVERIPQHLPLKIKRLTGCDLVRRNEVGGERNYRDVSATCNLEPYSKEHFLANRASDEAYLTVEAGYERLRQIESFIVGATRLLLEAGAAAGSVSSLIDDFEMFLLESYQRLGLKRHMAKVLIERYERVVDEPEELPDNSGDSPEGAWKFPDVNIPKAFDYSPITAGSDFLNHYREKVPTVSRRGKEGVKNNKL